MPLHNDKAEVIGSALIFRDVTEQSLSKKRLAESKAILKGILQNTRSVIYIEDVEGKYLMINKQAEKVFNIKASDLIGRKTIQHMTNDLSDDTLHSMLNTIVNARLIRSEEKILHPDGTMHNYHSAKFPLFDSEHKVFGICTILTDISERMAIHELKVQLSVLSIEKGLQKEALDMVDRLQKKNKDLQQFVYTVSHDLHGPITRVLGLIKVSKTDQHIKINNKTVLENEFNELTDLENVVKDMNITIAVKGEDKNKEYVFFDTKLKLVEKVLRHEIIKSKAFITVDFDDNPGVVTVKSYLYSIMYNLLSNAIKYRLPGVPLKIEIQSNQVNEFICLTFKDNGMGIDMVKNGDKIFGLFNRFHDNSIEGKGIGLSLVKTQAEALGGKVEVESEVNQGSTFKIFFPITSKALPIQKSDNPVPASEEKTTVKAVESKEEAENAHRIIAEHHALTYHLELAAKFNKKAARFHQSGKHYEGEQSALLAQGHYMLAGKYHTDSAYHFDW